MTVIQAYEAYTAIEKEFNNLVDENVSLMGIDEEADALRDEKMDSLILKMNDIVDKEASRQGVDTTDVIDQFNRLEESL